MTAHRWLMDRAAVCRCANCGVLWIKQNRQADDCQAASQNKTDTRKGEE